MVSSSHKEESGPSNLSNLEQVRILATGARWWTCRRRRGGGNGKDGVKRAEQRAVVVDVVAR